MNYFGHLVGL